MSKSQQIDALVASINNLSNSYKNRFNDTVKSTDNRLSNSREWVAETVSEEEAVIGQSTLRRAWSALRVSQLVIAFLSVNWWTGQDLQVTLTGVTGARTLSLSSGSIFDLTLSGPTTLSLTDLPTTTNGYVRSIIVRIRQPATAMTITWWTGY